MAVLQAVPDMGGEGDASDPEIAETARLAQAMPADETQLLYSLCLHGRGDLGLAPDEYAALTMVLLRLLAFKPSGTAAAAVPASQAVVSGGAAEPAKKQQPEPLVLNRSQADHGSAPAPAPEGLAGALGKPLSATQPAPNPDLGHRHAAMAVSARTDLGTKAVDSSVPVELAPWECAPAAGDLSAARAPADACLGDVWSQTVNQLIAAEAVAALTRELALQSELGHQAGGVWTLRVEQESLSQPAAREKLQAALRTVLADAAIRVVVEVGAVTDTPARRNAAALAERQRAAEALIHNDPFVQDMIRDWGAKIVPGSIKSVST
jgi:DNA polymerase-3 subunit gamma/tau